MIQEHSLTTLFHTYADLDQPPILELLNIDNKPVGALYLKDLRYKNFMVSETNNSEKYYLYINGVGIYFSFFQKIAP
jgi:cytochrome b involved in lipid metabolism